MRWRNKGNEFNDMAEIICCESNVYYIWGAGVFGESFYNMFKEKINIRGFIDSAKSKQGKYIGSSKIFLPDILDALEENQKIIIANGWITECSELLEAKGYIKDKDFFHANEFLSIYMLYKEKNIYAISLNLPITTKCTLKCEKCMALMPYVKNPRNFSLEEIQEELEVYFQWVDYVGILGIGGGDVLVHPNFANILKYICEEYVGKKVNDVEIYTNAIIIPSEEILDICQKYNVIIRFSDYRENLPGRQKIEELITILKEREIRYDCAKWDTWYDIGFPQTNNGLLKREQLEEHYDKCITKLCAILFRKRLYFCSVHASAVMAGYCEEKETDSFDLQCYSEEKKKEFIEFNSGYCENGYLSYCMRCNGYQNINDKFVPVAKQLQK